MSRLQRFAVATALTLIGCTLLASCEGTSSSGFLPPPYSQGQTGTSTSGGGLQQTTPDAQTSPPTVQAATATPAPPQCYQYQETGKGLTRSVSTTVPSGCVLVTNAYAGNLAGHDWSGGAVLAAPAGVYSGSLTDGAYKVVSLDTGPQEFCAQVQGMRDNNNALSNEWPLPGWPVCS